MLLLHSLPPGWSWPDPARMAVAKLRGFFGEESHFRSIENISGQRRSLCFDGIQAYQVNPAVGRVMTYHGSDGSPEDRFYYVTASSSSLLFPLMNAEKQGASLNLLSQSENGAEIEAVYPDATTRTFQLNAQWQIIADQTSLSADGIELQITRNYGSYKDFDGAQLPASFEIQISGEYSSAAGKRKLNEQAVYTLQKAQGNVDIKQEFFSPGLPERIMAGSEREIAGQTFILLAKLPLEKGARGLFIDDLNQDGKQDILVLGSQAINVIWGDNGNAFSSRMKIDPKLGFISDLELIDQKADGKPDVVFAVSGGENSGIYYYDTLLQDNSKPVKILENMTPGELARGRLNGDQYPDLAVFDIAAEKILLFSGKAEGRFEFIKSFIARDVKNLFCRDLGGDGIDEVLFTSGDKILQLSAKDGEWSLSTLKGEMANISSLLPFDLNGDSYTDLAVTRGGATRNAGSQGFALLLGSESGFVDEAVYLKSGSCLVAAAEVDLNGDSIKDLLSLSAGDHLVTLYFNEENLVSLAGALPTGIAPVAVATKDLNGDKKIEIVILSGGSGEIYIWSSN
jgi:hypothetical protein